jgi:hypothetical protein
MLSLVDPSPNLEGAAALYGYISNANAIGNPACEIHYDNLKLTPNR